MFFDLRNLGLNLCFPFLTHNLTLYTFPEHSDCGTRVHRYMYLPVNILESGGGGGGGGCWNKS